MCGIAGYIGKKNNAGHVVLDSLKRLEYRGYDSYGVAALDGDVISVHKKVGKVSAEINGPDTLAKMQGSVALGHTRWATHGAPSVINTHPHTDYRDAVAVVHNGIIENHKKLRRALTAKLGNVFHSETDTEVIPHLLSSYLAEPRATAPGAFMRTLRELEGKFAIVAMVRGQKMLLLATNGPPLCVGIGKEEYFIGSDVLAFINHTNKCFYLESGECAVVTDNAILFFSFADQKSVAKDSTALSFTAQEAALGTFPHFMKKEIFEQASILSDIKPVSVPALYEAARELLAAKNILITACGTAAHMGYMAKYFFERIAAKRAAVVLSSEVEAVIPVIDDATAVVAISQSGETADVLEAVCAAKEKGARIISLVNARGSSLERMSDVVIPTQAGKEIAVASTKAATAQMTILYLLACHLKSVRTAPKAVRLIEEYYTEITEWLSDDVFCRMGVVAEKIIDRLAMNKSEPVKNNGNDLFVIGRGSLHPVALEIALKVKEISYIHADGLPAGELKHGTLALVEEGTPALVLFGEEHCLAKTDSNAQEMKTRGAFLIGMGKGIKSNSDFWLGINVPYREGLPPLGHMIAGQILAYQLAVLRGSDPDKPRNLAKSVTVS